MTNSHQLSFGERIKVWQADRAVLALAVTCALPLFVHALPLGGGRPLGFIWLPVFYAPLAAVFLCRTHVAVISALLAPAINHLLFRQPDALTARMLTLELIIFVLTARLIVSRWPRFAGTGVAAYAAASLLSLFLLGPEVVSSGAALFPEFLARTAVQWPGLLMIFILELLVRRMKGQGC